jgi:hypothetical protein
LCASAVAIALVLLTRGTAAQTVELRPNLVAYPAGSASLSVVASGGIVSLRFATTSWNNGTGPLELRAGDIIIAPDGSQRRKVNQRVYLSDGTYYDKYAGEFEYHPEHQHFHFENYALYTLKPVNAPGASSKQSAKTTFCVMDTTKVNTTLPGAPLNAVYSTCGADIQGMSVGWGDTYGASLPGQAFDVTDNPDGDYDIIIEIDPKTQLIEGTRSDNVSCLRVHLSVSARTVKSLGACSTTATVTIDSITPNYMYSGTVLSGVTIKGSGFVQGMAVGLEGSGQAPIASEINVVDSNTITLTVTAKSAGGKREKLYDVRVSSAVLPKSFAVKP